MIKLLRAWLKRREYPHVTKSGWRFKIVGNGVIHVDRDSVIKSERFKELLEQSKELK